MSDREHLLNCAIVLAFALVGVVAGIVAGDAGLAITAGLVALVVPRVAAAGMKK